MKTQGINVLSLFDGMSCGQIALKRLGLQINKYYASEIDKHAIKVTQHNFPETIQLGDVTQVSAKELPKIDLLLGGSPCQGFSFAGKQLAFDDPRSKLFFEYVRLWNEIKEINPDAFFLLENVKMKKEHELVISKYLNIAPIEINSTLVSAQNRVRLYWTNIANQSYGLFGDMECVIPQPKDKKIFLKDILEQDIPEKYYLSDKMLKYFENRAANFNQGKVNVRNIDDKASCLTSSSASCDISDNFIAIDCNGKEFSDKAGPILARYSKGSSNFGSDTFIKIDTSLNKSANQDKANCLSVGGNSGGLHSDMTLIVASRGRNPENPKSREVGLETEQMLEPRYDGKTNCLTSVQKDNLVMQINPSKESHGQQPYQQNRVYDADGKAPALMSQLPSGSNMILDKSPCLHGFEHGTNGQFNKQLGSKGMIRRLTPVECERLQTVPEGYTDIVSDTQRYRMLGNGWTVDVIAHILSYLPYQNNR